MIKQLREVRDSLKEIKRSYENNKKISGAELKLLEEIEEIASDIRWDVIIPLGRAGNKKEGEK